MSEVLVATVPPATQRKCDELLRLLAARLPDGLIVAFSGGVDSAFLLWAAEQARKQTGGRVLALTAVSDSMAAVEREDAARVARELGVEHRWEQSLEVADPKYAVNDGSRCYHCKTELFRIGRDLASHGAYKWLAYGYNASDRGDTRPGHRAALENGVLAPLAEAELTKDDIRILMRAHGLHLWDKPSSPCLSSRLMTGVAVTPQRLADVEALEALMREAGIRVMRARIHEADGQAGASFVRVEAAAEELPRVLEVRDRLAREARARGYRWVMLDLDGYKMGGGV